jgi:hypothetical protein
VGQYRETIGRNWYVLFSLFGMDVLLGRFFFFYRGGTWYNKVGDVIVGMFGTSLTIAVGEMFIAWGQCYY